MDVVGGLGVLGGLGGLRVENTPRLEEETFRLLTELNCKPGGKENVGSGCGEPELERARLPWAMMICCDWVVWSVVDTATDLLECRNDRLGGAGWCSCKRCLFSAGVLLPSSPGCTRKRFSLLDGLSTRGRSAKPLWLTVVTQVSGCDKKSRATLSHTVRGFGDLGSLSACPHRL